jgi:hypothetical protein
MTYTLLVTNINQLFEQFADGTINLEELKSNVISEIDTLIEEIREINNEIKTAINLE